MGEGPGVRAADLHMLLSEAEAPRGGACLVSRNILPGNGPHPALSRERERESLVSNASEIPYITHNAPITRTGSAGR